MDSGQCKASNVYNSYLTCVCSEAVVSGLIVGFGSVVVAVVAVTAASDG